MSDTPKTDDLARGNHVVPTEWAEHLERERDEWRKIARELWRERNEWRGIAEELCNAAAYGLAQWDDGYSLKVCKQICDAILRFRQMKKEEKA